MPGNWGLVIVAGLGFYFAAPESALHVSLTVVIVMIVVAGIGEILEFVASSLGVNKLGGSKKGALLAVVGRLQSNCWNDSGVPIPIIGKAWSPPSSSVALERSGCNFG